METKTLAILCYYACTTYRLRHQYLSLPVHSASSCSQKCTDIQSVTKITRKKTENLSVYWCSVHYAELLILIFQLSIALQSHAVNTPKTSPEVTTYLTRCCKSLSANQHSSRHPVNLASCIKPEGILAITRTSPRSPPVLPSSSPQAQFKDRIIMTSSVTVNQETRDEIQDELESCGAAISSINAR